MEATGKYDYHGTGGFVLSRPVAAQTLEEACGSVATAAPFAGRESVVVATTWSGQAACRVDGPTANGPASALVVPHPYPFEQFAGRMTYAALIANADNFISISGNLSFSPDRVTPEAYVTSVLDLLEARAYFADGVDWDLARQDALNAAHGMTDLRTVQDVVTGIVQRLAAAGDEHSRVFPPVQSGAPDVEMGVGFLIGERRVLLVYPGSPGDRAGVRAGDLIEAVDNRPFFPTLNVIEPSSLFGLTTQLTVRRPGVAEAITVTIEQGPYSQYVTPSGRRLPDGLGYLEVEAFSTLEMEADYVATARSIVAAVDQPPACGWIVDLRLDFGGSYPAMIAGVGPILGNGTFLGWNWPDGRQTWVAYDDGRITDDGQEVSDSPDADFALQRPNPPVAVLTGPLTVSSGEVSTLAFVGRSGARLFGETTGGLTTGNAGYPLFDGTTIALAVAAMTDRSGMTYPTGIAPDEHVPIDWETFGTDADPVLQAAEAWLAQQPACSAGTPTP